MGAGCGNDFRNEGKGLDLRGRTARGLLFLLVMVGGGKICQG